MRNNCKNEKENSDTENDTLFEDTNENVFYSTKYEGNHTNLPFI